MGEPACPPRCWNPPHALRAPGHKAWGFCRTQRRLCPTGPSSRQKMWSIRYLAPACPSVGSGPCTSHPARQPRGPGAPPANAQPGGPLCFCCAGQTDRQTFLSPRGPFAGSGLVREPPHTERWGLQPSSAGPGPSPRPWSTALSPRPPSPGDPGPSHRAHPQVTRMGVASLGWDPSPFLTAQLCAHHQATTSRLWAGRALCRLWGQPEGLAWGPGSAPHFGSF